MFSQRIEPADLCWSEVKIQDSEQKYSGRNGKACLASACCFSHGWGVEMCAFGSWDCLVVLLTSSVIDPYLDDDTPWLVFYSFGFITSHQLQNCSLPMCRTSRHATWLMVPAEALIPAVLCPQKWSEHGLCDPTIIQNPQFFPMVINGIYIYIYYVYTCIYICIYIYIYMYEQKIHDIWSDKARQAAQPRSLGPNVTWPGCGSGDWGAAWNFPTYQWGF